MDSTVASIPAQRHVNRLANVKFLRQFVVLCCLLMLTALSLADARGTYNASINLSSKVSSDKVDFSLDLKADGNATFKITRNGRFTIDRDATDTYGDWITFLESPKSVSLTGSWNENDDKINIRFSRVSSSEDSDNRNINMDLYKDQNGYRVDSWDESFFANTDKPRFVIKRSSNGNDLLAGLAIIAGGALIINEINRGGSGSGTEYTFKSRGSGTGRFDSGDRDQLDEVRVELKRDNNGTVTFKGDYDIEIRGTWRKSGSGYNLRVSEIKVDGRRSRAWGNVYVNRDYDRDRARSVSANVNVDRSEGWRSLSLDFRTDRD